MDLSKLIKCYDNVLPETFCNYFINFLEKNISSAKKYEEDGTPNFTKLDFTGFFDDDLSNQINTAVAYIFHEQAKIYAKDTDTEQFFPINYEFEALRVKKYMNNDSDEFRTHVDIGDAATSTRFLNMFCYLNDVEQGGETKFPFLQQSFKPKRGSLLIFPPYWFFPHSGEKPISGPKYLLATNLHYC